LTTKGTDKEFYNKFMAVLGLLVATCVGIFFLATFVGNRTQLLQIRNDPAFQQRVEDRIRPIGQVAVAGMDNTGLRDPGGERPAAMPVAAAPPQPADLADGGAVYQAACAACHTSGIAGAPATGDRVAWAPRIDQGMDVLVRHAIEGFQGPAGYMPPRGGHSNLSDEQVRLAVQHMVDAAD
jgi:cytochrome c5